MENKKATFITIVVLLAIFLPLAIIGLFNQEGKNMLEENPNHEFFYKGHLWFYDNEDKFLSKYECQTELCKISTSNIDDVEYNINYFKNGTLKAIPIIDNKYTFITDGVLIYLYDVENGSALQSYKAVKNYNVKTENNVFIIQNNDGLWGTLTLNGGGLANPIKFEYDFIGLLNNVGENGTLRTNKYIVKRNNKWYIIDENNSALSGYVDDPIVDYTNDYIFTKDNNKVRIYSYENFEYLQNVQISDYVMDSKYIGIKYGTNLAIYDHLSNKPVKLVPLKDLNDDKINLTELVEGIA